MTTPAAPVCIVDDGAPVREAVGRLVGGATLRSIGHIGRLQHSPNQATFRSNC
jgi:hypothetical protein